MFEDWSVDVDQADKHAAQPPGTRQRVLPAAWEQDDNLLPIDRRLGSLLLTYNGPQGIYPGVPELARQLGCSARWVRKRLEHLEQLGYVQRIAVHEVPEDAEWQRRERRISHLGRQTSNAYQLVAEPPQFRGPPGTPTNLVGNAVLAAQPPGTDLLLTRESVPPLNSNPVQPVSEGEVVEAPRAREPLDVGDQRPLERLDYDPSKAEILATLEAGLGPVTVVAEWPNDQLPPRSVRRWQTKEEAAAARRRRKRGGKRARG